MTVNQSEKEKVLRIGELSSLGAMPYFFPLKHVFKERDWEFVQGSQAELDSKMARGELDVGLCSPMIVAASPREYRIFPNIGYGSRRHIKDVLFFSDMLLDDMDEMSVSVQEDALVASALIQVVMGRYLQYQNEFIMGWNSAEAHVLAGDPALRERLLARYAYVYDVGDLWRHYTGMPMIYNLWVVRTEALREKEAMIVYFHRILKQALAVASSDFSRLASMVDGYEWIKKTMISQFWKKVDYHISPDHFEGLHRFYEDCVEIDIMDDTPDLEYFEYAEEEI